MKDLNMTSSEYRQYRQGLSSAGTKNADKIEYITKKKFTPEEEDLIIKLIKEGKRSIDIVKIFGGTTVKNKFGRRICDKVRALKKTGLTFND